MKHPLGLRVDSPWRVWLFVFVVTGFAVLASLITTIAILWLSGLGSVPVAYGIASLVPLMIVPPVTFVLAQIAYELTSTQEELLRLASTDELTGLYNRRAVFEQGNLLVARATDEGQPLSLLLLDADNFKDVNDTFGHMAGDEALRYLAEAIRICCQQEDVIARFGGDEFVILRPRSSRQEMIDLAAAIQTQLNNNPFTYGQAQLTLSMSAGTADTETEMASTFDTLLSTTDIALYACKSATRLTEQNGKLALPMTNSVQAMYGR